MPRYAIVYSVADPAGKGAALKLKARFNTRTCSIRRALDCGVVEEIDAIVVGFREDVLELEFLDEVFDTVGVEAYIVLSRHSSTSGTPTLSLHYPGNPGPEAPAGGRPRELAVAYPSLAKTIALTYKRVAEEMKLLERYEFTLEATHHGPTGLSKPIVFVEIGSTEKEWSDERAQEALALAVSEALRKGPTRCRASVGIGDTHYPRIHTRLMLETDICYGHIFARYTFNYLDESVLVQSVEKSVDKIVQFVLQKPPSRIKKVVEKVARELGLDIVKA